MVYHGVSILINLNLNFYHHQHQRQQQQQHLLRGKRPPNMPRIPRQTIGTVSTNCRCITGKYLAAERQNQLLRSMSVTPNFQSDLGSQVDPST